MPSIAKSKLWIEKRGGPRRPTAVSIGRPERDPLPGGDYRCLVRLTGLERERYIHGVDSLQALMFATIFLNKEIKLLQRQGWQFFAARNDKDPLDLSLIWAADGRKLARMCHGYERKS